MAIAGVLWDMDGVLVDTGEFHYKAWSETLAEYHIPYSYDLFLKTFGMNNRSILTLLWGYEPDQQLQEKVSRQKEEIFRKIVQGKARPLPGVVGMLQLFASKGIRQAIASSAPPENINLLVDTLNLRSAFDAIVSGFGLSGKPAPDVFLAAAKAIGIPAGNCLVIEDAVTGVEGAKRAGMCCLAVTNTNPAEKLRQADYIVDSLLQIEPGFLEEILGHAPAKPE
jgi:HAD superfamily hydrolase (TIGR01509 family)